MKRKQTKQTGKTGTQKRTTAASVLALTVLLSNVPVHAENATAVTETEAGSSAAGDTKAEETGTDATETGAAGDTTAGESEPATPEAPGEVPAGDAEPTPGEAPAEVPTDAPAPEEIPAVPSAEALQIMQDSPIKITEILYDADGSDDGTEFLEISNLGTKTVDISGYMIGDEETRGGGEGMFAFPQGTKIAPGQSVTIAQSSLINKAKYRYTPDFELPPVEQYNPQDDPDVPNLLPTDWATGTIVMANGGDDVLLMDDKYNVLDYVPYIKDTTFNGKKVKAAKPLNNLGESLQRIKQTGDASVDFYSLFPSPGTWSDKEPEEPDFGPSDSLIITEVMNDPLFDESTGEFVEITNISDKAIDISGYLIGDEETKGGSEGMHAFPPGTIIQPYQPIVVARYADGIVERHQTKPDFEIFESMDDVPQMLPTKWATGSLYLANSGDHVILADPEARVIDAMVYGDAKFPQVTAHPGVAGGHTMERLTGEDTNDAFKDFVDQPNPTPGGLLFGPDALVDKIPKSDLKENVLIVKEPETGVVSPVTVIGCYQSGDVSALASSGVSSVFLMVGKNMNGQLIVSAGDRPLLADALDQLANKAIPILSIESKELVPAVHQLLTERSLTDVHIVSSNPEIVREMREKNDEYRGAILDGVDELDLAKQKQLVKTVRASKSNVLILPYDRVNAEVARYFRLRGITVWAIEKAGTVQHHDLVSMGVRGIISAQPETVLSALAAYPTETLTQPPIVYAHRGIPSKKPENTMYSFQEAIDLGADIVETDIHKTKDGKLVLIHDFDLERTTNGTGKVKDYTLAELRALVANKQDPENPDWYQPEITDARIPTLDELLEAAKGKAVLDLEAKSIGYEKEIIEAIEAHDMVEDVILCSFSSEVLNRFAALNPEVGLGYVLSGSKPETKKDQYAEKLVTDAIQLNAQYFLDQAILTPELARFAKHRGLPLGVYTVNENAQIEEALRTGVSGVVTDYAQRLLTAPIRVDAPQSSLELTAGEVKPLEAIIDYRVAIDQLAPARIRLIDNHDAAVEVAADGKSLIAKKAGKAKVQLSVEVPSGGKTWKMVTTVIEVKVN